jgi:hypothetical protein
MKTSAVARQRATIRLGAQTMCVEPEEKMSHLSHLSFNLRMFHAMTRIVGEYMMDCIAFGIATSHYYTMNKSRAELLVHTSI